MGIHDSQMVLRSGADFARASHRARHRSARASSPARFATPPAARFPAPRSGSSTRQALATVDAVSDEQGAYRADALAARHLPPRDALDGFETAVREVALEDGQTAAVELTLTPARLTEGVVVTARRVEEAAQDVPIPLSVVNRNLVENAGAFNVNRLKELIPTVQFYSTNPRNSAINIRGLGAPFGLTNDGLEPGVGLYIDGVFYARPAAATLDFLDVERIEVLRGPQGTLFGKNTTAGAINVTTRKPSFTRASDFELNVGDRGFVQAKASVTSPFGKKVAGRLSFSGTQRDGTVYNVRTQERVNDLDNAGHSRPAADRAIRQGRDPVGRRLHPAAARGLHAGRRRRRADAAAGESPVPADRGGPSATRRRASTPSIASPTSTPPLRSYQDLGGSALNVDWKVGPRCADVDQRLALLELESVERSRLHRPAGHDGLRGAVEAAAVERGDPLRRRPLASA